MTRDGRTGVCGARGHVKVTQRAVRMDPMDRRRRRTMRAWRALGTVLGLVLGLTATPRVAHAVIGTIDPVPAATLLLPYFEVDPAGTDAKGVDTLLSINNASATAILTHVTIWSDMSVAVAGFNIYLTGYDAVTMDLRDVLNGSLPQTASAGQDPMDKITPKGMDSQDINFASCTGQLPLAAVDPAKVAQWKAALSGKPDPTTSKCSGFDHGDGILRGYVTADTINNCTLHNPGDTGYILPGFSGDITGQNTLWGEWSLVDRGTKRYQSASLVGIEASSTNALTNTAGHYTFYGRYAGWNAYDFREPLATNFAARYDVSGGVGKLGKTTLVVWRDTKVNQMPFTCSTLPSWYPLAQHGIAFFDDQEHPQLLSPTTQSFPIATQRVEVDSNALPANTPVGWMYLDLNASVPAAGSNPSFDPNSDQGWVEVLRTDADPRVYGARSHVGAAHHPVQLDNASAAVHFYLFP